jgi:hypothetical protein
VFQRGQERFQGFSVRVDGPRVVVLPDRIQIKQAERKRSIKMYVSSVRARVLTLAVPTPAWAKVVLRERGGMTAPVVGSG